MQDPPPAYCRPIVCVALYLLLEWHRLVLILSHYPPTHTHTRVLIQVCVLLLMSSLHVQNIKREWDKVNKPNEKGELDDSLDGEELVALLKGFLPGLDVKSKRFKFLKAHADPDGDGCR